MDRREIAKELIKRGEKELAKEVLSIVDTKGLEKAGKDVINKELKNFLKKDVKPFPGEELEFNDLIKYTLKKHKEELIGKYVESVISTLTSKKVKEDYFDGFVVEKAFAWIADKHFKEFVEDFSEQKYKDLEYEDFSQDPIPPFKKFLESVKAIILKNLDSDPKLYKKALEAFGSKLEDIFKKRFE